MGLGARRRTACRAGPQAVAGSGEPPAERRKPPAPSRPGGSAEPVALQSIPTRVGEYTFTKLVDEQEHDSCAATAGVGGADSAGDRDQGRPSRRGALRLGLLGRSTACPPRRGRSAVRGPAGRDRRRRASGALGDPARSARSRGPGRECAGSWHACHRSALARDARSLLAGRPETNGTGARMLAERLARLVRTSATHRGVPMEVAIGIAVCPDDGTEAPALAARADLGVYSARATGRSIAHTDPPTAS